MTTNLIVYESVGNRAKAIARVFLADCDTDAPRRLAEYLISQNMDVRQFTWCYQLGDGTVDIQDIFPRPGHLLKQVVTQLLDEWPEKGDNNGNDP